MAFKALAAHNWHVRDAQSKGMGRAALHIRIWSATTCSRPRLRQ